MLVKLENRFSKARQDILTLSAWCIMNAVEWRPLQLAILKKVGIKSQPLHIF
jgi:hypothetical protein